MPTASGSIAYLGAARFQGYWNASNNDATGSGLSEAAAGAFSTLLVDGGYHSSTNLTASAGDYWQITGSGTTSIDGQSSWALNDWCIYSASAGGSGAWLRLAFEDTISSIIVGDLSSSSFHMGTEFNKHVVFSSGSNALSGSDNFTFNYDNNSLELTGTMHVSGAGVTLVGPEAGSVVLTLKADQGDDAADTFTMTAAADGNTTLVAGADIVLDPGGNNVLPGGDSEDDLGADGVAWRKLYVDDIDLNGQGRIDLDADADTSIRASADDVVKIEVGGADLATLDVNGLQLTGSLFVSGSGMTLTAAEAGNAVLVLRADQGDDAADVATLSMVEGGGLVISGSDGGLILSGSKLVLGPGTVPDTAVTVSADQVLFIDADGAVKRETITDLATAMAGNGLNASAGQIGLHFAEIGGVTPLASTDSIMILDNGSITKRVTVTTMGDYLTATSGGLANTSGQLSISGSNIADGTVAVANDQIIFLDADGSVKRETIDDLASGMAGTGLDASSGQLTVDLSEVIASDGENRLLTTNGDGTATAEASLTYNGTTFNVHDDLDITGSLSGQLSGSVEFKVNMKHNNTGQFSDRSGNQFLYLVPTGVLRGPAINATGGGNSGLGFATSGSSKARIFHNEEGDGFLVVSGSSPNGTVLSGNFVRIPEKLAIGVDTAAAKTSGILVVQATAADTTNGLIATFRSDDSDYCRLNIDNGTANGDTQFTFMSNGSSKWSVGNMGSNETLHIKSGFGEFEDTDPFILTTSDLSINTSLTASNGLLISDDEDLHFGTHADASIKYRETEDNLLVISGSAVGMVLSGSNINIGGNENLFSTVTKIAGKVGVNDFDPKVTFSTTNNYQMVTFENQLSDGEGGGERLIYSPGANDTLTAGQIYFLHTDGSWNQADGGSISTGGTQLLAVAFAGSSQQVGVLLRGFMRIPSTEILNVPGSGAVDGLPVYVSTTAGHFDFTPPSSSSQFARAVGHAIDDDSGDVLVYFNPEPLGTQIP